MTMRCPKLARSRRLRRGLTLLGALCRADDGVGAVEFAIIAPIMVLFCVGIADLGIGVYTKTQVNNAAQYGAEYALLNGFDADAISSAVKNSTSLSNLNVSPTQTCGCPSSTGMVASSCSTTCSDGSKAGSFAQVQVTDTYTTLIPYPGLPASFTLTAQSTARLQ
jgi:Flp pilus assembly protein TadG